MANERTCIICNNKYYFCSRCPGSANMPSWKNLYDTEECKTVFEICSAYVNKMMTKGDAIIKLKSFKIPDHLNDKYQGIVDEILHVEKPVTKKKKSRIIQIKDEAEENNDCEI